MKPTSPDRMAFLEFVLGMWAMTRDLVGKPDIIEADETLSLAIREERARKGIIGTLARTSQITLAAPLEKFVT